MQAYTTDSGEQAYVRYSYPLANKSHKCDHADCPYSHRIDRDTTYTKLTVIITGEGIYTERYHDLCYR